MHNEFITIFNLSKEGILGDIPARFAPRLDWGEVLIETNFKH